MVIMIMVVVMVMIMIMVVVMVMVMILLCAHSYILSDANPDVNFIVPSKVIKVPAEEQIIYFALVGFSLVGGQ